MVLKGVEALLNTTILQMKYSVKGSTTKRGLSSPPLFEGGRIPLRIEKLHSQGNHRCGVDSSPAHPPSFHAGIDHDSHPSLD